jgi:hypothetical protein
MNKNTEFFGIDISKDVFDVYSLEMGHHQFTNNEKGFNQFIKNYQVKVWWSWKPRAITTIVWRNIYIKKAMLFR